MTFLCSGEGLYEAARGQDGARWSGLDDEGKAIWRDAEQLISDRLTSNPGYLTVKFSKQLVERMGDRWTGPLECKLEAQAHGTAEMWCRYAGGEIPDEVVEAVRERVYGTFDEGDESFLGDCREIVKIALDAWRRAEVRPL